jgi:hypothetical protein
MGESKKDALRVNFDKKLKLEFHGVKVSSDTVINRVEIFPAKSLREH